MAPDCKWSRMPVPRRHRRRPGCVCCWCRTSGNFGHLREGVDRQTPTSLSPQMVVEVIAKQRPMASYVKQLRPFAGRRRPANTNVTFTANGRKGHCEAMTHGGACLCNGVVDVIRARLLNCRRLHGRVVYNANGRCARLSGGTTTPPERFEAGGLVDNDVVQLFALAPLGVLLRRLWPCEHLNAHHLLRPVGEADLGVGRHEDGRPRPHL